MTPSQLAFARLVKSANFALRPACFESQLPHLSNCMALEVTLTVSVSSSVK